MRNLVLFVATGAGSGYSPFASGTVGSVVGLALFALVAWPLGLSMPWIAAGLIPLTALAIWTAGEAERIFARKDDGRITIDEVAGMWVTLIALPVRIEVLVAGFFLFRFFDILKPPPARQLEHLGGGTGIVADDLMAGLYANLAGQLLWRVLWVQVEGWLA